MTDSSIVAETGENKENAVNSSRRLGKLVLNLVVIALTYRIDQLGELNPVLLSFLRPRFVQRHHQAVSEPVRVAERAHLREIRPRRRRDDRHVHIPHVRTGRGDREQVTGASTEDFLARRRLARGRRPVARVLHFEFQLVVLVRRQRRLRARGLGFAHRRRADADERGREKRAPRAGTIAMVFGDVSTRADIARGRGRARRCAARSTRATRRRAHVRALERESGERGHGSARSEVSRRGARPREIF